VIGKIQGGFFRRDARREADKCGFTGWVDNRGNNPDEVTGQVQGDNNIIKEFLEWLWVGGGKGKMESVVYMEVKIVSTERGFGFRRRDGVVIR